jgi:hypothetical protein
VYGNYSGIKASSECLYESEKELLSVSLLLIWTPTLSLPFTRNIYYSGNHYPFDLNLTHNFRY